MTNSEIAAISQADPAIVYLKIIYITSEMYKQVQLYIKLNECLNTRRKVK